RRIPAKPAGIHGKRRLKDSRRAARPESTRAVASARGQLIPADSKTKLGADSISGVAMLGRLVLFLLVLLAATPAMAGG
ncbi:hypothetical protein ABTM28_21315, partial [Acinetobacter baumannii]